MNRLGVSSYIKNIYVLVSVVLAIAILLQPLASLLDWPAPSMVYIGRYWFVLAVITATVFALLDSILSTVSPAWERFFWVAVMSGGAIWVSLVRADVYLIALLFFFHAVRSAGHLWTGVKDWWMWPAWVRDCVVAMTLFICLMDTST